jgi:hypothetical protein
MTQEVQVTLTIEVDAEKTKKDIEKYFQDMELIYTRTVSQSNRMEFSEFISIKIKEEAEIYGNV